MTNKQIKKFFWQVGIYGGVLAYLAADLFLFHGPLSRKIAESDPRSEEALAIAKAGGIVAQVFNHPITRSQVERAAHERLWRLGKNYESLSAKEQLLIRYAALDDLIDHELLRVKAMVHTEKLILDSKELDARLDRFKRRFSGEQALHKAMKSQGIENEQDLRDRIAAQMQQEAYVELRIAENSTVTEEEAKAWFEENREALGKPEQRNLRHIFIPSLDVAKEEAQLRLETVMSTLAAGKSDFTTLAKEVSMDPATKHEGGELGWVARKRLPADFADAVWDLPLKQAVLIKTSIGWHVVEVLQRQAAQKRNFEEAREEVIAAMRSVKRRQAIKNYRKALRQFEGHRVTIYHQMMK